MCEPTTIIMVGAALVGAYATYEGGQTEQRFAKFEAAQASADAQAEKGDAQVEAARIQRAKMAALADANVALAGSGQDLGSAGALGINKEISRAANEDAFFAVLGGRDRSARINTQGQLTLARGKSAANGATLSAFGQVLGAAGTAAGGFGGGSGWTSYNRSTSSAGSNMKASTAGKRY